MPEADPPLAEIKQDVPRNYEVFNMKKMILLGLIALAVSLIIIGCDSEPKKRSKKKPSETSSASKKTETVPAEEKEPPKPPEPQPIVVQNPVTITTTSGEEKSLQSEQQLNEAYAQSVQEMIKIGVNEYIEEQIAVLKLGGQNVDSKVVETLKSRKETYVKAMIDMEIKKHILIHQENPPLQTVALWIATYVSTY